jgi:hypothetical protein
MAQRGWVHIIAAGEHGLRRGSWFEVVDDADPEHVVVEVNRKRVAVARSCVERHATRPLAWTVVVEAVRPDYFGSLYAVCPDCLGRASVRVEDMEMTCPSCGFAFPVDWSTAS